MAVTLPCQNCGEGNDLGRVFCNSCGVKLNTSQVTPESLSHRDKPRGGIVKLIFVLIGIVIVAMIGLAFWPATTDIEEGTKRTGRSVEGKLKVMNSGLRSATKLGRSFSEKDVNSFIAIRKTDGAEQIIVDLSQDGFVLLMTGKIGPVTIGSFSSPALTRTFTLRGHARKGQLTVSSGAIGHIPLIGPLKQIAASAVRKALLGDAEEIKLLSKVSNIKFGDDQVEITVSR